MPSTYLSDLADDIDLIPDRREVLELMVALGKELDPLPADERVPKNLVPGCVSNVHITARLGDDGTVHFQGSSDAHIVRGYVRALIAQFDGMPLDEFLATADDTVSSFLARTDLATSVIPTRANSIGNILLTMKKKALELREIS